MLVMLILWSNIPTVSLIFSSGFVAINTIMFYFENKYQFIKLITLEIEVFSWITILENFFDRSRFNDYVVIASPSICQSFIFNGDIVYVWEFFYLSQPKTRLDSRESTAMNWRHRITWQPFKYSVDSRSQCFTNSTLQVTLLGAQKVINFTNI